MRKYGMQVLIAVLLGALGFTMVSQARSAETNDLSTLRNDELADLLRTLDARNERLSQQIDALTKTRDSLRNSNKDTQDAEAAAQQRADQLAILAGTVPVTGPGIKLTLSGESGDQSAVTAAGLLNAIEELRDAGAEAIVVNNTARVVAQTYFLDDRGGIVVGSQVLSGPYVITAIGDSDTLAEAMRIRGGVIEQVQSRGGAATVATLTDVTIEALAEVPEQHYAQVDQ
jgi:uncharacterized protein YlxW (UPF0749 family)